MNPSVSPDPRFRAWLVDRGPRLAPPGFLDRSVRVATAVPQDGRWARRLPILRFATSIVATVALVAIIGTALILWPPPIATLHPSPSAAPSRVTDPTSLPSDDSTPSAPPRETATPTPATPVPVEGFREWTRVDMPDPAPEYLGGATPVGMVRLGDLYVAVGGVRSSDPRAVVWTSSDGLDWQLNDDPPGLDALEVTDVVTDGARLLVLGTSPPACCPLDQPTTAWLSTDGSLWTRIDADGLVLAAGGLSGFVGAFTDDNDVRFSRSRDGLGWSDASATFEVDEGITALALDPSGEAVAIAHVTEPSDEPDDDTYSTHIVAWRSVSGSEWEDVGIVAENAVARAIVAGPRGFVVVGHQTIDRVDGSVVDSARIWRLTPFGLNAVPIEFSPGQTLDRVFVIGDRLIATGVEMTELGDSVIAWQSSDGGATWTRLPGEASLEGSVTAVIAMVGGTNDLVAVGHGLDPESGHLVPVAWVATR